MKLVLKSFGQDVSLEDKKDTYYLVFEDENGKEVRLPVPKDTSRALITIVFGDSEDSEEKEVEMKEESPEEKPEEEPYLGEEEDISDATKFGGEEPEGPEETLAEEEVPSL